MAELRTIKGRTKTKRKENAVKVQSDWGRGCKDETCFTVFKNGKGFLIASPLKIMGMPGIHSFEYIAETMFHLDFNTFLENLSIKYKADIARNSKFRYLIFNTEQDARNCKNYLNKLLREM